MIRRFAMLMLLLFAASAVRAQGTVSLKPVARLSIGIPVTLADVAELSGSAQHLADVEVVADPLAAAGADNRLTITMDDLQRAIHAGSTSLISRLRFTGSSCTVILRPAPPTSATEQTTDPIPAKPHPTGLVVRDHIEARLLETLAVSRDRLELTFANRDMALLMTPTTGWTVDVQPTGSSAELPLRITMYDRSGDIRDESIRVGVRILRDVVRTSRALRRGSTLTEEDLTHDTAWLAPDVPFIEPNSAVGLRLKRNVGAGDLLTAGRVELGQVIKKGDIVAIHVISGSIVIRTPARALASGRIGDQIEFESLKGDGTFTAEVKAPGRAVLIANMESLTGADH